jgi:hypothetical protein
MRVSEVGMGVVHGSDEQQAYGTAGARQPSRRLRGAPRGAQEAGERRSRCKMQRVLCGLDVASVSWKAFLQNSAFDPCAPNAAAGQ